MDMQRQQEEVDRNYDAFQRQLADLIATHDGQIAVMRDGRVVGCFGSVRAALTEARQRFPDGIYSIQEVTREPIDLGVFSHAGN